VYKVVKNECSLFTGLCHFLSALQSHCKADMLKRQGDLESKYLA